MKQYFDRTYHIHGGSKIPVICFYSLYQIIINEMKRYENCHLKELEYHTTCDRTSKSSGDIEIFKQEEEILIETMEIKYNIEIDSHIINRVIEKIHKFNPERYYILSTLGIKGEDFVNIQDKVSSLKSEHGCQIIINGIIPTVKYYLRLISDLQEFVDIFTNNILVDTELKLVHKKAWKELHKSLTLPTPK